MEVELLEFLCNYTIEHAMVPGKIESYNVIIDLADVGLFELPINLLRILASRLTLAYKQRVATLAVLNIDWRIKYACNFVFSLLDSRISDEFLIFSDNGPEYFRNLTSKDRLQQKYGGDLPNKTDDFFPPHYN